MSYSGSSTWPLTDRLQNLCIKIHAHMFCVHKLTLALPRAAHRQAANAQGGLADADGDGLASFAAGPDAII